MNKKQVVYAGNGSYQLRIWDDASEHYKEMALDPDIFESIYRCKPMHAHICKPDEFDIPFDIDNSYAKERFLK